MTAPAAREYVAEPLDLLELPLPVYCTRLPPQPAHPDWPEWRAMCYAPTDGTEIVLLIFHSNRRFAEPAARCLWEDAVRGHWTTANGGMWCWTGMAGLPTGWRPLRSLRHSTLRSAACAAALPVPTPPVHTKEPSCAP